MDIGGTPCIIRPMFVRAVEQETICTAVVLFFLLKSNCKPEFITKEKNVTYILIPFTKKQGTNVRIYVDQGR